MKDYYKILGVNKKATPEEIKRAYYKLAHRYHPDKGGGDEKLFKEINEAYQTLSDEKKRGQYDKFGRVFDEQEMPSGFQNQWGWGRPDINVEFGFEDLGDIFEEIFGSAGQTTYGRDLKKGGDIKIKVEISLKETLQNTKKEIRLKKLVSCPRCHGIGGEPGTEIKECFSCRGTGRVQQIRKTFLGAFTKSMICPECSGEGYRPEKPCNVCKGEGRIRGEDGINIVIPAGIDTNQIIRIKGRGNAGKRGGKSGDLYARVLVDDHPVFQRKGDDLYMSSEITFSQAVLGDEIEFPTLEGKSMLLKIPSGTDSGKTIRISGKGIPHFSGRGKGDLYVKIDLCTPKKPDKNQRKIFQELKREGM